MTEVMSWLHKRNEFNRGTEPLVKVVKYKVLVFDNYGKLFRDFTLTGPVDLSSATAIGQAAIKSFPGMAVQLQPVLPQVMALAAHA